jgi:hypothetical protein
MAIRYWTPNGRVTMVVWLPRRRRSRAHKHMGAQAKAELS